MMVLCTKKSVISTIPLQVTFLHPSRHVPSSHIRELALPLKSPQRHAILCLKYSFFFLYGEAIHPYKLIQRVLPGPNPPTPTQKCKGILFGGFYSIEAGM